MSLAAPQLLGRFTSASQAIVRAEVQLQIQEALNGMEPLDREIIALRHFEEFCNAEAARCSAWRRRPEELRPGPEESGKPPSEGRPARLRPAPPRHAGGCHP